MLERDAAVAGEDALDAQPGGLFDGEVRGEAAVRAHHPVPRQVVAVDGEDAAHQAGRADAGLVGDLPVAAHLAGRDRPDDRAHALDRLVVHAAIVP